MTRSALNPAVVTIRAMAATAVMATLALLHVPSAPALGQRASPLTGTLVGTVVDSSGTPVAAARVHVVDTELNHVSDVFGRFLFLELDAGTRALRVSARGYRTSAVPNVVVRAGEVTRMTVTLARVGPT
jgi:hypothetical protein